MPLNLYPSRNWMTRLPSLLSPLNVPRWASCSVSGFFTRHSSPLFAARKARRLPRTRFGTSAELLEVRLLLAADVTAQLVGGSLFITGTAPSARSISLAEFDADHFSVSADGVSGTTVSGNGNPVSVRTQAFPIAQLTGGVFVNLNGATNFEIAGGTHFNTVHGSTIITISGAGNDSVSLSGADSEHKLSLGSLLVTTSGGDDTVTLFNDVDVAGATIVNTGNGNDAAFIDGARLHRTSITMGDGANHAVFIGEFVPSTFTGSLSIRVGDATGSSNSTNAISVSGPTIVTGSTTIAAGNAARNFVSLGGSTASAVGTSEFGTLSINTGNGANAINVTNLNARSLNLVTGSGANAIGIGTATVPPLNIPLFGTSDTTVSVIGGAVHVAGSVSIVTLGGATSTVVQGATVNGAFVLYNVGLTGSNTFDLNDATFGGTFVVAQGGTGNSVNIAQQPGEVKFHGPLIVYFFGATSAGGGGSVSLGIGGAAKAEVRSNAVFIGASVTTSDLGASFNPALTTFLFSAHSTIG